MSNRKDDTLKIGMDVENFLTEWAVENSEELVLELEDILDDQNIETDIKIKKIYTKTLNFVFYAISQAIMENNKTIEKQLRRAGVQLP